MLAVQFHRLRAVRGFGHHVHVGLHVEDGLHAHARDQVIFGDQNADRRVSKVPSLPLRSRCPGVL